MTLYLTRRYRDQTRWGVFTNLWPTRRNQIDRAACQTWYLNWHLGIVVVEAYGKAG